MQLVLLDRIEPAPEPAPAPVLRLVTELPPLRQPARGASGRDPRPVAENFARGVAEVLVRARSVDQLREAVGEAGLSLTNRGGQWTLARAGQ